MNNRIKIVIVLLASGLTACGMNSAATLDARAAGSGDSSQGPSVPSGGGDDSNSWGICGNLNFNNVIFPASLSNEQAKAMALSLSVSGSFEGRAGWANLAGNFDGMGISMGLLQQNFGTGSLQPLLLKLESASPSTLMQYLTVSDLKSLEGMLITYASDAGIHASSLEDDSTELFSNASALSPLDVGYTDQAPMARIKALNSAESASVAWAATNVLSSTNVFVSRWKTSFTNIANSAAYRTIQVGAALNMFNKALGYFDAFGFSKMSSLLLMYDFVVQDGGFTAAQKASFETWVRANPSADETTRAKQLLEIRLAAVRPEYRADVRVRKLSIINSTGVVHGSNRNLPKEFCYSANEKI